MKNIKIISLVMMLIVCVSCSKNHPPSIQNINVPVKQVEAGSTITITAIAVDQDGDSLTYVWSAEHGTVPTGSQSAQIEYKAPNSPGAGRDRISVIVSDGKAIDTSDKDIALIPNTTGVAETATSDGAETATSDGAETATSDGAETATSDGADATTNDGAETATKVTVVPDSPVPPTDEPTLPTDTPTSIATATEPPTFTPAPLPITQVIVNQSSNVRSGPGTTYDTIGTATNGETFEVLGTLDDDSWWYVNFNGQEGWIHNSLVTLEGSEEGLKIVTPPPLPATAPATDNTLWVDNFDDCDGINLTGGENGSAYKTGQGFMVESYPTEERRGCVARLDYDITWWSAFFMKIHHSDLSPYSRISFLGKG